MKLDTTIQEFCIGDLATRLPLKSDTAYVVTLRFDPTTLVVNSISADVRSESANLADGFYRSEINQLKDSELEIKYDLRWLVHTQTAMSDSSDQKAIENALHRNAWRFTRDLMDWIDENLLLEQASERR